MKALFIRAGAVIGSIALAFPVSTLGSLALVIYVIAVGAVIRRWWILWALVALLGLAVFRDVFFPCDPEATGTDCEGNSAVLVYALFLPTALVLITLGVLIGKGVERFRSEERPGDPAT